MLPVQDYVSIHDVEQVHVYIRLRAPKFNVEGGILRLWQRGELLREEDRGGEEKFPVYRMRLAETTRAPREENDRYQEWYDAETDGVLVYRDMAGVAPDVWHYYDSGHISTGGSHWFQLPTDPLGEAV